MPLPEATTSLMPTRKTRRLAVVLTIGAAVVLAACGGGSNSARDATVDRAVADGLGREQASCIVDGVAAEVGDAVYDVSWEPDADELDIVINVTDECLFGEE